MTNEQKAAVERAAEENGWVAVFSFTKGAEHVIDNPREFGLIAKSDINDDLDELSNEYRIMQSQLTKYREALERIAEYDFDTKRVSPHTVAKEALKQQ